MALQTIQVADKPTLDAIKSSIDNTTYGLNALKVLLDTKASGESVSGIETLLNNSTYGLEAIKSALGNSSGGGIKSVQRGVIGKLSASTTLSSDSYGTYSDVTITSVNTSKSFTVNNNFDNYFYNYGYISKVSSCRKFNRKQINYFTWKYK